MPNKYQTKMFRDAKKNALMGLVDALDNRNVPERIHDGLTSGSISQYFDDRFLPLRPMALLTILREVEVPHDSNNRFLTWTLYEFKGQMEELLISYLGLQKIQFKSLPAKSTEGGGGP